MNLLKAIKISLAVIVLGVIAVYVIGSLVTTNKLGKISTPKNQFTTRIEKDINALSNFLDNKFHKMEYDNINLLIDDYYKPHPPQYPYGRLGNTQSENDQWNENLTKNLYSAYVDKFISQAFFVFRGSEWRIDDLNFIRSEYQTLRNSKLLEKGSPVDKKFVEIQTVFSKYDEIAGFILACNGFTYSASGLSDRFPTSQVQGRISQAAAFQNDHLGNEYVNNCLRLHNGLKEIQNTLFRAHVRYLDNKVSQWSGLYSNYNSQSDYVNNLYKPLKSEIEALDNGTYNVVNLDTEYKRLSDKWTADNTKAYTYSYPTKP